MAEQLHLPSLPDPIPSPGYDAEPNGFDVDAPDPPARRAPVARKGRLAPLPRRVLRQGAYFLQWQPTRPAFVRYNGTLRIERHDAGVTASGDLYRHPPFKVVHTPGVRIVPNPDPSPSAGIPIFARSDYRYYLRVTQVLEWFTLSSFTLGFELYQYDAGAHAWTNQGLHTARMQFKPAPAAFQSGATYLEGPLLSPAGSDLGTLRMGWVSSSLRTATLEIDRVADADYPADDAAANSWATVFESVDWDVDVYESDTALTEPSGESWSDAEMHAAMLERRDSSDLDAEWRYHILCVRRLDSTSRGIMYDAYGGDSNNIPREGASIASHWVIPDTPEWGAVRGMRFGTAAAPYFRTAVHEIGHAMGLYHNTDDNGYMNTTNIIAATAGTFPSTILWSYNAEDAKRLRHMPDCWVRPGTIPFGLAYASAPLSPTDAVDLGEALELQVEPLLRSVPLGAPTRVKLTLTNRSDSPITVPPSLSLKDEHVSGTVYDPADTPRTFRSIMLCTEHQGSRVLAPGDAMADDLTLLRGHEGALFPSPGLHRIEVVVAWDLDGVPVRVVGSVPVMVSPPMDQSHADAATAALTEPDLLLTLAIGGDHLQQGNAALETAMHDDTLAPHYAVVAAKRVGRPFRGRPADPGQALDLLGDTAVMSTAEADKIADLVKDASPVRDAPEAVRG